MILMAFDGYFLLATIGFGLALMMLGLKWQMTFLNIISIFIWLFLAVQLSDYALMVAVMVGMMFLQIYMVIRGGRPS